MRQELERLPNCSCLETVHREHQPAGGKMRPLDTVRLEVLYNGHHELYASPGDRGFSDNQPADFIASGTIGNGHFALYLSEIVGDGRLSYEYKGEEVLLGRSLAHYEYSVPVNQSGHTITVSGGQRHRGCEGIILGRSGDLRHPAHFHGSCGDSAAVTRRVVGDLHRL